VTEQQPDGVVVAPQRVEIFFEDVVVQVAATANHTACVTDDGALWTWGEGSHHQLGLGATSNAQQPVKVSALKEPAAKVATGATSSACITLKGQVFTWGDGIHGELGQGSTHSAEYPVQVKGRLEGTQVVQISMGHHHTACITKDGHLFAWGQGQYGKLGLLDEHNCREPKEIMAGVSQVCAGKSHTMCVDQHGALFSWGQGACGKTGHGNTKTVSMPTRVLPRCAASAQRHPLCGC